MKVAGGHVVPRRRGRSSNVTYAPDDVNGTYQELSLVRST